MEKSISLRFLIFSSIGGLCYLIGLFILWLFTSIFNLDYRASMAISFFLISPLSFFLNEKSSFKSLQPKKKYEFRKYFFGMLASMLASLLAVWFLVEKYKINYLFSNIIVTSAFLIINFSVHYLWTFKSRFPK